MLVFRCSGLPKAAAQGAADFEALSVEGLTVKLESAWDSFSKLVGISKLHFRPLAIECRSIKTMQLSDQGTVTTLENFNSCLEHRAGYSEGLGGGFGGPYIPICPLCRSFSRIPSEGLWVRAGERAAGGGGLVQIERAADFGLE